MGSTPGDPSPSCSEPRDQLSSISSIRRASGRPRPLGPDGWFTGELRNRRYIDVTKDTQFTDAWLILGILLTLVGLAANSLLADSPRPRACLWSPRQAGPGMGSACSGLHYRRRFSETRAFLGETMELTLEVRNRKFLPATWLQIIDIFPERLPMGNPEGG